MGQKDKKSFMAGSAHVPHRAPVEVKKQYQKATVNFLAAAKSANRLLVEQAKALRLENNPLSFTKIGLIDQLIPIVFDNTENSELVRTIRMTAVTIRKATTANEAQVAFDKVVNL